MILAPLSPDAPMGIYIHIPFCAHICPYCDFTTYAGKNALIPRYVAALERDLTRQASRADGREVASVFIGGGTPSLLDGDQMRAILDACRDHYRLAGAVEITMESNPNSLDAPRLADYRAAGIDRLSIGAQTLDRRGLRRLGRQHEAGDVLTALASAHEAGFLRVSVDAIFGWPGQTVDMWRADLDALLTAPHGPNHLSLYSLIVEPGTPFADAQTRGILHMPDDDATADMYELAMDTLAEASWTHYEIANWSRDPGDHSRHNALYWQNGDYLGVGAGAHGHLAGTRTLNHLLPERWIEAVETGGDTTSNREQLDHPTVMTETFLMGMRMLRDGIDADAFARRHGTPLERVAGGAIGELEAQGLIERTDRGIRLTRRGTLLADGVIARLTDFAPITH